MNYAALQQAVNRLMNNMFAWIAFIPAFVSLTPQYVSITLENPDGTESTVSHANLAKMKESLASIVFSETRKVLYVDPYNGDDGNTGAKDSPLDTVKEAIDRVPEGGVVFIYIMNNAEILSSQHIYSYGKTIYLRSHTTNDDATLTLKQDTNGFVLGVHKGGGISIEIDTAIRRTDSSYDVGVIEAKDGASLLVSYNIAKTINAGSTVRSALSLVNSTLSKIRNGSLVLSNVDITADSANADIMDVEYTANLGVSNVNLNGAAITTDEIKEMIQHIYYDADSGVPTNVKSVPNLSN